MGNLHSHVLCHTRQQAIYVPFPLGISSTHPFTSTLPLDVRRATAGAKLLMRFGASIIDKYNALPEEERDTSSILGHLIRMQVPHERARLADVVGMSFVLYLFHSLLLLLIFTSSLILPQ